MHRVSGTRAGVGRRVFEGTREPGRKEGCARGASHSRGSHKLSAAQHGESMASPQITSAINSMKGAWRINLAYLRAVNSLCASARMALSFIARISARNKRINIRHHHQKRGIAACCGESTRHAGKASKRLISASRASGRRKCGHRAGGTATVMQRAAYGGAWHKRRHLSLRVA